MIQECSRKQKKLKMLVPIEMLNSNEFIKPLSRFLSDKVEQRKLLISSNLNSIIKIIFDLLKDVEQLEPRFSCALLQQETNSLHQKNYYKGRSSFFLILSIDF